ncbi:MAG: DUF45 domain-containing protein [Alphaproteobacteria bacterium]|nr:DUF45 domain-containing protein [Alphaproteobacteria bacterium]MBL0717732.1 DUF45 domain-containing protein [Alphaproteobacteria bacterium]
MANNIFQTVLPESIEIVDAKGTIHEVKVSVKYTKQNLFKTKKMKLSIKHNAVVVAVSMRESNFNLLQLEKFWNLNQGWIKSVFSKRILLCHLPLAEKKVLSLLGEPFNIHLENRTDKRSYILDDGKCKAVYIFSRTQHFDRMLRRQLRELLYTSSLSIMNKFLKDIDIKTPVELKIAGFTSCWGNCQSNNMKIKISEVLVLAPRRVLEYVIAHEVSHLVHAHHQKDFWILVNSIYNEEERSVDDVKRWLKKCGDDLIVQWQN